MEGLIKSSEQMQAEQQQAQQQALIEQNSPEVVKEGMGIIRDAAARSGEQIPTQQQ